MANMERRNEHSEQKLSQHSEHMTCVHCIKIDNPLMWLYSRLQRVVRSNLHDCRAGMPPTLNTVSEMLKWARGKTRSYSSFKCKTTNKMHKNIVKPLFHLT